MPGLLDQGDDADTLNAQQLQALLGSGDPRAAQLFLGATTAQDAPASDSAASPPAAPSAPPDGAPSPAAAAPDDQPSFLDRFGGWVGKAGLALAGGDPALAGLSEAQSRSAGTRALLQFGLSMLANSGPSYTPRNFGQILAAGLESAGKVPLETEQLVATNQQRQSELALKRAGLQIQGLTAQARLDQLKLLRDQIAGGKKAADDAAGGGGSPAPSLTPGGSPASPGGSDADFVTKFAPIAQQVSQDTGLPADFITSQAALETGYGRSPAAQKNNFFGITGADGKPLAFDTPEAGVKAYTDLLKSDRYKGVTRSGDHKALGDALALAGYNSNVPAEGKADSYGTRIAAVGQRIAGLRAAGAPGRVQVAGPGAGTGGATTPPAPTPPGTTPPAPTAPAAPAAPGLAAPPAANLPPALVTPPDLPPMVAPSIADLQPERDAVLKDFEARRRALASSPNKDTAKDISELEKQRDDKLAALNKEARDRQVAFDDQRRKDAIDYQLKVAAEARAAQQKQAEADAELQRQMKLKEHEQELAQKTSVAGIQTAVVTDTLKKSAEAATSSRELRNRLSQIRAVLPDLPNGGMLLQHFPEMAGWLNQLGWTTPSQQQAVTGAQLLAGLTGQISTMMRPLNSGTLRTAEMANFQRALPSLSETPEGRAKALAFLENAAQRMTQENDFMQRYAKAHGDLIGVDDAMDQPKAKGGLGPMIQSAPDFSRPAAEHKAFRDSIEVGQPYYAWKQHPDGTWEKELAVKR
jgi:hypothetical protein